MYSLYKDVHRSTAIEYSESCNFFNSNEFNLVTATTNTLNVFRLSYDIQADKCQKLVHLAEYQLFGTVIGLSKIRFKGDVRDSVVLAFKYAKLSIVQWDPDSYRLRIVSMHNFETNENLEWNDEAAMSLLRVAPKNNCVALLLHSRKLCVLPFTNLLTMELEDDENENPDGSSTNDSYVIDLTLLEPPVMKVIDMQFLHGYHEPTVVFLFEPIPTWCGRLKARGDTCAIAAISLSASTKVHPIIWHVPDLPYDCDRVLAVPDTIRGILVFSANMLIYLNQSAPPFGIAVNCFTRQTTSFPHRQETDLQITLDNVYGAFLTNDHLVVSTSTGLIYSLCILVDGMNAVKSITFTNHAPSVQATCFTVIEHGYIFIGSRMSPSQLLRYSVPIDEKACEPAPKKSRVSLEGPVGDDELSFLETEEPDYVQTQLNYIFACADSLMNIGPCGAHALGIQAASKDGRYDVNSIDKQLDLVVNCGHNLTGGITILNQTIRPRVVSTFDTLGGAEALWTVRTNIESDDGNRFHSYLILGKETSNLVLETGTEFQEVEAAFISNEATIHICNLAGDRLILQVTKNALYLSDGTTQLWNQEFSTKVVESCSVSEPYVVVTFEDRTIALFKQTEDSLGRIDLPKGFYGAENEESDVSEVLSIYCFCDRSGLLVVDASKETSAIPTAIRSNDGLDEDDLLYGDTDVSALIQGSSTEVNSRFTPSNKPLRDPSPHWFLFVLRADGRLEIISLPDLRTVYVVTDMGDLPWTCAHDTGATTPETVLKSSAEVCITQFGHKLRPHLFLRYGDDIAVYEAYRVNSSKRGVLKINWFKKETEFTNMDIKNARRRRRPTSEIVSTRRSRLFHPYDDVNNQSGLFICGAMPTWCMMSQHGKLNYYPMIIDGTITAWVDFHNVSCQKGFCYFNKKGELRVAVLNPCLRYDFEWPVVRKSFGKSIHYLTYHLERGLYAAITSEESRLTEVVTLLQEEKEFEHQERGEGFIWPTQSTYFLQLISPEGWEWDVCPSHHEFEKWEQPTCIKEVQLRHEHGDMIDYLAVGTNFSYSEDVQSRGRIYLFQVTDVVQEPGLPLTRYKLKKTVERDEKGPITALVAVSGFLLTVVGQRMYLWTLRDGDILAMSFVDIGIYIFQAVALKNLVLMADVQKSLHLVRYQEDFRTLSIVARDVKPMHMFGCEYLVDGTQLSFISTDSNGNMQVFGYQPELKESCGGTRLVPKADFHIGQKVQELFRIRSTLSQFQDDAKLTASYQKRHVTYLVTADGGIAHVVPLREQMYRRLHVLQTLLMLHVPHTAALNPKAFRLYRNIERGQQSNLKNVLDGTLIALYFHLPNTKRMELAKRIGMSIDEIMCDLVELRSATLHF